MILDPIKCVTNAGAFAARMANRIIAIYNLLLIAFGFALCAYMKVEWYYYLVCAIVARIVVAGNNFIIAKIWELVGVTAYGTEDPDEILDAAERFDKKFDKVFKKKG